MGTNDHRVREDLVFWGGTLFSGTFEERLAAASAGGFSSVSMFPVDYKKACERGLSDADMRALAEERGVRLGVLDPLTKWLPAWEPPPGTSRDDLDFLDFEKDEFFRMAEALGVRSLTVIEAFGAPVPAEVGAASFARVCDRAADLGLRVHLEFQPYSGVPDLASAWEIVRLADRPNGGVVFDVWHYFRGNPDEALLRSIPGEKIFVVQVADAPARPEAPLREDLFLRRPPGEGDFDLVGVLRTLEDIGGLSSVGAEIFSFEFGSLPPEEAGRKAGSSLRSVLDAALQNRGAVREEASQ